MTRQGIAWQGTYLRTVQHLCVLGQGRRGSWVRGTGKDPHSDATHRHLGYNKMCYVMLCYVMLCYVMCCYVKLCDVMLCDVMLCYMLGCDK
jgi:hypothetical protein